MGEKLSKKHITGAEIGTVSKDETSPKNRKKRMIICGAIILVVLLCVGGYFTYKHFHKRKLPPGNFSGTKLTIDTSSPTYTKLNDQQKLASRLDTVSQYAAVDDYQKVESELTVISADLPNAKNDINFLMYQFTANYQLKKEQDAIASAKAVKATGKPIPAQFTPWKGLVDQYAAK